MWLAPVGEELHDAPGLWMVQRPRRRARGVGGAARDPGRASPRGEAAEAAAGLPEEVAEENRREAAARWKESRGPSSVDERELFRLSREPAQRGGSPWPPRTRRVGPSAASIRRARGPGQAHGAQLGGQIVRRRRVRARRCRARRMSRCSELAVVQQREALVALSSASTDPRSPSTSSTAASGERTTKR